MKKTICRLFSLLLTLALTCGLLVTLSLTASADPVWDGSSISRPEGTGTEEDPFLISTAEELAWVSYMTEHYEELNALLGTSFASSSVFEGMFFVQIADIDLGGNVFSPIGTTQAEDSLVRNAFGGWYIGAGFTIGNGYVDAVIPSFPSPIPEYETVMEIGYRPAGLFGVLSESGVVYGVHASNLQVGTCELPSVQDYYTPYAAGVIVGTTYRGGKIIGCTADENCWVFAMYGAGGIVGIAYGGEMGEFEEDGDFLEMLNSIDATIVAQSVNNASVASARATGGIVGFGYNTVVSTCLNNGTVEHVSKTRWSGAGGIMGMPLDLESNQYVIIEYCINSADAWVEATSAQATGKNNRVAVGGIMGNDDVAYNAEISYVYCYNLEESFAVQFWDGGNSDKNCKASVAGIVGYAKDSDRPEGAIAPSVGTRTYSLCYSVPCDYTVDTYGLSYNTFDCNYDPDNGRYSSYRYAGIISALLTPSQVTAGIGNSDAAFASCEYGVSADEIKGQNVYQTILAELGLEEHVCWFTYGIYNDTYHIGTCDFCGETEMQEHQFDNGETVIAATHSTYGLMRYTCVDCGYETLESIPKYPFDHDYAWWICLYEDENIHYYPCLSCSGVKSEEHSWGEGSVIVRATCASNGLKAYTCKDCGHTKHETLAKQTHLWNEGTVALEATHLTEGMKIYTCLQCDQTKIETLEKNEAHTHGDWQSHDDKQHKKGCACGDAQYADHVWNEGAVLVQPTTLGAGVKIFACKDCGATRTESIAQLVAEEGCNASLKGSLAVLLLVGVATVALLKKKKKKD